MPCYNYKCYLVFKNAAISGKFPVRRKKLKPIKKFRFGLKQVFTEVVTGLLTTMILTFLSNQGWLPDNVLLIINIILIVMNLLLIRKMWSWGIFYTVGWLIGSFIFFKIGMFNTWQIIIYLVLPIVALFFRVVTSLKRSIAG
jgi:hypothetical protein